MKRDYELEVFTGPKWTKVGSIPFIPLVRESLEKLFNWDLKNTRIRVTVVDVPHDSRPPGLPIVENLVPDFGFTYVTVFREGQVIYQHPHPIEDVVARRLQELLRDKAPDDTLWGFRLDVPGMPPIGQRRQRPDVENGFTVRPFQEGERPRFQIRRLEQEKPPPKSLEEYEIQATEKQRDASVKVVLSEELSEELLETRPLSDEVEEGGFLIGQVFQDAELEGAFIVEVTDALTAQHTGASLLHFTFTGDSFAEVKRSLRSRNSSERIVGWYHTHLFPATSDFGLSSIDLTLHFGTFRIAWQLAGLINLDLKTKKPSRTLRFYVREDKDMVQCPHWASSPGGSSRSSSEPRPEERAATDRESQLPDDEVS